MNTFEAAILRDFGEREDFERVLTHALRRGCGGRILLSLMADGSLRLTGTKDPDISFGRGAARPDRAGGAVQRGVPRPACAGDRLAELREML